MKFIYSLKTLHTELERLYSIAGEFTPEQFEKTNVYRRILEVRAAIRLLEGYNFKLSGDKDG